MAFLEATHALLERGVEAVVADMVGRQIALGNQAVADLADPVFDHAGLERRAAGDLEPSGLTREVAITSERSFELEVTRIARRETGKPGPELVGRQRAVETGDRVEFRRPDGPILFPLLGPDAANGQRGGKVQRAVAEQEVALDDAEPFHLARVRKRREQIEPIAGSVVERRGERGDAIITRGP